MPYAYANEYFTAVTDGSFVVPCDPRNKDWQAIQASGEQIAPYAPPPLPPVTCQLWQLQAVMTPDQWAAAQGAVAALGDPAVSAFFAHGTSVIPENSATLISLGAAIGLSASQVAALVRQGSKVSIP